MTMRISGLYAILDLPERHQLDPAAVLDAMIDGGAAVIQLRSKQAPLESGDSGDSGDSGESGASGDSGDSGLVRELGLRCAAAGVPLILNDELELAERCFVGVAGVHLGQGDLSRLGPTAAHQRERRSQLREAGLWLGVSTHDLPQLREAIEALAPDYVGFGPVFSTASKPDHDPVVGLEALARACALPGVPPVVAIGGVQVDNANQIARCGAAAIASIGALSGSTVELIRERTFTLARAFAGE